MSSHYILLLLLFLSTPSSARKLLHHPFFPLTSSQSPSQSPSIISPKHPFSTSQNPFFPSNPSPPPPTPHSLSSLPTFPANISSLITPPPHSSTTKLLKAIFFPIVSLLVLSLFLLFIFFHRKKRLGFTGEETDNDRLFPINSAASDSSKPVQSSGPVGSEFLYLGTLVSSRGQEGSCSTALAPASSPELHPLPPLERQVRRSSSDEFYSTSDDEAKRLDFYVSTLSSPIYASSNVASSSSSPCSSPHLEGFLAAAARLFRRRENILLPLRRATLGSLKERILLLFPRFRRLLCLLGERMGLMVWRGGRK